MALLWRTFSGLTRVYVSCHSNDVTISCPQNPRCGTWLPCLEIMRNSSIFLYPRFLELDVLEKIHKMSDQLSSEQLQEDRPFIQRRGDSQLPPHERKSHNTVPATPGNSKDTYTETPSRFRARSKLQPLNEDVFSSHSRSPLQTAPIHVNVNVHSGKSEARMQHAAIALRRNVISATFTVPQLLQHREGSDWVTQNTP